MLLADQTGWNLPAIRRRERYTEHSLGFEYPLRMMPQRTVTKVADELLRSIEPIMDVLVIAGLAAELASRTQRVVVGVHCSLRSMLRRT